MLNIKSPSFTFGVFLIIFALAILFYGKELETLPTKISRMCIMFILWIIIYYISKKYKPIYGWGVGVFLIVLMLFNLWQRVKYTSDPNYYDTFSKIKIMRSNVVWRIDE
jgi:hypothetical protein